MAPALAQAQAQAEEAAPARADSEQPVSLRGAREAQGALDEHAAAAAAAADAAAASAAASAAVQAAQDADAAAAAAEPQRLSEALELLQGSDVSAFEVEAAVHGAVEVAQEVDAGSLEALERVRSRRTSTLPPPPAAAPPPKAAPRWCVPSPLTRPQQMTIRDSLAIFVCIMISFVPATQAFFGRQTSYIIVIAGMQSLRAFPAYGLGKCVDDSLLIFSATLLAALLALLTLVIASPSVTGVICFIFLVCGGAMGLGSEFARLLQPMAIFAIMFSAYVALEGGEPRRS